MHLKCFKQISEPESCLYVKYKEKNREMYTNVKNTRKPSTLLISKFGR